VRKAAVIGCAKVWRHSPDIINNNGIVDVLYTMVRDQEPSVMTFALQTINVILARENGVVINSAMANYFLTRLEDCKDLEKVFILE
jgi:vesicle coat complex subunit